MRCTTQATQRAIPSGPPPQGTRAVVLLGMSECALMLGTGRCQCHCARERGNGRVGLLHHDRHRPPCRTATPGLAGAVVVLVLALVGGLETWSLRDDWRATKRGPYILTARPQALTKAGSPRNPLSTLPPTRPALAQDRSPTHHPPVTRNVSRPADVYWPRNINLRLDIVLDQTPAPPVANRRRSHPQAFSRPPAVHARQADVDTRAKYPETQQRPRQIYRFAHLVESGIPWPFDTSCPLRPPLEHYTAHHSEAETGEAARTPRPHRAQPSGKRS